MTNAVAPSQGTAGVDRAVGNLMLDALESSLQQAGIKLSPESRDALQNLRDQINHNQRDAAHRCHHGNGPHRAHHAGPADEPASRDGVMPMLMKLLMMLLPLLQQMQENEQANRDAASLAPHLKPGNGSLRELGAFFEGVGEGIHQANKAFAQAIGFRPH